MTGQDRFRTTRPALVPIRTVADIERLESVPWEQQVPETCINEAIRIAAAMDPAKAAIHFLAQGRAAGRVVTHTYADLVAGIDAIAALYLDLGGKGVVVGLALPNLPEMIVAFLAAQAVGRAALVNPLLEPVQISEILRKVKARVLVVPSASIWPELWSKVEAIRSGVPDLRHVIVVGESSETVPSHVTFPRLSCGRDRAEPTVALRPAGTGGALLHTGGTTGSPKIAPITDAMEVYAAWVLRTVVGFDAASVVVGGMPLHHAGGLYVNTLAPLSAGATAVILGPHGYRNRAIYPEFWSILDRFGGTYFLGVPTVVQALLATDVGGADISRLRYCSCGGAPVSIDVLREFQDRFGISVLQSYGLTEGGVSSIRNPRDGWNKLGSVGIRNPYQKLRIVELDSSGRLKRDCEPGEVGTLIMTGPNVFPGYLEARHNEGTWIDGSWLNTGDLARQDADGYYWLCGRAKDLIIRGGHNIDPVVIEEALNRHPAVSIAAAVGQPDAYAGETPVAYVQLRPGAAANEADLLEHARACVSERAACPARIFIVDAMPTTAVGKVYKPELRSDATCRVVRERLDGIAPETGAIEVGVGPDAKSGIRVTVTLRGVRAVEQPALAARTRALLATYPFQFEIAFAQSDGAAARGEGRADGEQGP